MLKLSLINNKLRNTLKVMRNYAISYDEALNE